MVTVDTTVLRSISFEEIVPFDEAIEDARDDPIEEGFDLSK